MGGAQPGAYGAFAMNSSVLIQLVRRVVRLFDLSGDESIKRYHPEDHYMRGPGPKWREKHLLDRAAAGRM
jgi:hypothetical protein